MAILSFEIQDDTLDLISTYLCVKANTAEVKSYITLILGNLATQAKEKEVLSNNINVIESIKEDITVNKEVK